VWVVKPFESFGPLGFRTSRGEVQAILGEAPQAFFKGGSTISTEAYKRAGVHAYYGPDGLLELVEAFPPCRAEYAGVDLLEPETTLTLHRLAASGLEPRDDGEGGLWFEQHGFALYAPHGSTEGVTVFRRDYETGG
jgi:hypothetical protein